MKLRNLKWLVLLLAVTLFLGVRASSAQSTNSGGGGESGEGDDVGCMHCGWDVDTGRHKFDGVPCTENVLQTSGCAECGTFNRCHFTYDNPGVCSEFHWYCGYSSAAAEQLQKALRSQNPMSAVTLVANRLPKRVLVGRDGYAFLLNCKGNIVAAYPIKKSGASDVFALASFRS